MSDLREKRVELILQQLEQLPTLPSVALRVLEITGSDDSSVKDVVQVIQSDVALSTRILQLVHRADLGVRGEVSTIDRAIVLLGFEAVRSAVLGISVFQAMGGDSPSQGQQFSRAEFWKHSVAVACCAELLAEVKLPGQPKVDPSEAFVCGLLHDLGKVALDAVLPKSFGRVVEASELLRGNIADVERTVIGLDHMVVGKRLAERWQLPTTIRECIWLHGQLPQALPAGVRNPRLVNLITLADLLVREQHLGYSGNYAFTVGRQALLEATGVSDEEIHQVMQRLVGHIEPRAQALRLGTATTNELYQQALSQANRELARVSGQLASRNRKLVTRAKFFEALSGFQGELRADAPPQTVLEAIVQTAAGVLEIPAVVSFSVSPGQPFAEALLYTKAGDVLEHTLIDCPQRPEKPVEGDGPVLAAGDEMEWILSAVSPRLSHDGRFWICLEADNVCIGGVVWGALPGEAQRLSPQVQELSALAGGWALALRTAQIREEARNLTEQLAETNRQLQNAQNEIMRSKMMISVGEMAAGAAHEMNNPLAIISGRSQLLAQQVADPKQKNSATQIFEQSHRLSEIITELMHFAKPVPPAPSETDLTNLVDGAIVEAKHDNDSADRRIEVVVGEVPRLLVDGGQVRSALKEILDNAIQATDPQSGRITISAAFDPYSKRVVMTVADNGRGMDENTLKHAFDPFFSSRPAGRRRGMGLAKALRWLEASGGTIRLESRPAEGTRAILLLPAAPQSAQETAAAERKAAQ